MDNLKANGDAIITFLYYVLGVSFTVIGFLAWDVISNIKTTMITLFAKYDDCIERIGNLEKDNAYIKREHEKNHAK